MCPRPPLGAVGASLFGAVLLLSATGLPARAHAETERVHLRFLAPEGCPDTAAFIRALRQRTTRFRRAGDFEEVRTFIATITREDSAFSGRLETRAPGKGASERNVTGKDCGEVMAALAFMTALAIDPNAARPGLPATRPAGRPLASPPTTSPDTSDRAMAGVAALASQQPAPGTAPATRLPQESRVTGEQGGHRARTDEASPRPAPSIEATAAPATAPPDTKASPRWTWSAGVDGEASLGLWPTTGYGGLLFVEAAAPDHSVLGPVLRAGVSLNQSHEFLASGAQADFQWFAALAEGCPMRLHVFDSLLAAYACLDVRLGALRGQGQRLDRAEKTTDVWADLGPVARVSVAVWGPLFLEAQGMLVFPLRRISYEVHYTGPAGAATTVHTVPRLGALVGIGMGYQFR